VTALPRPAALALLLAAAGCSFTFTEAPPADHDRRLFFDCSTSLAPPIIDSVIAALGASSLVNAIGADADSFRSNGTTRAATIASAAVVAAAAGVSALHGYGASGACRAARDALEARVQALRAAEAAPAR
jgi:hypothetical protein